MKHSLKKLLDWFRLPDVLVLCALMMCMHMAQTGGRVAVMLNAVELGMSTFQVGILIAGFALLPMFMAISAGRRIDARGAYRPMLLASGLALLGVALPAGFQHWSALACTAIGAGIGHMTFQIATQGILGQADTATRLKNYAWFSMSMAISGFSGPLIAGLAIDHLGHRWSYILLAVAPLIALIGVQRMRKTLVSRHTPQPQAQASQSVKVLFGIKPLRYALGANLLLASAWDTHNFLVP